MATDNTQLSAPVGSGDTIRDFNDLSNIKWPSAVVSFVSSGSADAWVLQAVDLTHGMPVQPMTGATWAVTGTFFQATQPVSGTVTANAGSGTFTIAGAVTNAGTFAVQAAQSGTWTVGISAAQTIAVTNAGTFAVQATLSAETTKVIGTVNQGTSPWVVSLTSTTITGTVAATQSGTWTVGLSAAQTLATVTTVGTVTTLTQWNAGHGTAAAALRVELPTDGTGVVGLNAGANLIGYANEQDPSATTGNITVVDSNTTSTTNSISQTIITGSPTASSSVSATLSAHSGVTVMLSGTCSLTVAFERSMDGGTTFVPMSLEEVSIGAAVSSIAISDNKAYVFRGNAGEMTTVRVRSTAFTSGTCAVRILPGFGTAQIIANQGVAQSNSYPWPTADTAQTSGGCSISSFLSTAAVQATIVKASPGQVYSLEFFNVGAAAVFVRLYNQTGTPGTGDTVVWRGVVPGNTAGAGFVKAWPQGLVFSTGIGMRCTAAVADSDNTVLAANQVLGNVIYK